MTNDVTPTFHFENAFVRDLPADPDERNMPRQIEAAAYSRVTARQSSAPQLIAFSSEVARELEVDLEFFRFEKAAAVLCGNEELPGMEPYAMCYGGHQFGHWAGQLGDGRALNLGEIVTESGQRWALQLKGAGLTPYSRTADGLAVLRSSVREFLCSEAMFHLGIPTTRALSLCLSGDQVMRDMFYSGNPQYEPGAVVCRVAPSFIRFGNFQIFAMRGDNENLKKITDFCIRTDYPHLWPEGGEPSVDTYFAWLEEVADRTADMIVHWMRVGFVHGVMNTDNMSILGLTIDYGPYGWLEPYEPAWTPNTTDAQHGRYSFGNQAQSSSWNMMQLINAIYPLTKDKERSQALLDSYSQRVNARWHKMMAEKLGLKSLENETDESLAHDVLDVLQLQETDYCIFFRLLSTLPQCTDGEILLKHVQPAYYDQSFEQQDALAAMRAWLMRYADRLKQDGRDQQQRQQTMDAINPKYVLRNYLAQQAIEKSTAGDHRMIQELLEVLRHPYDEQPGNELYAERRPEWARSRPGCSTLSCSS
ncbi:MAG: YdiU family protein [Planctomycetes bacterium]|nr:YdiU family protein [Planctomycetota bacterium]